MSDFDPKGGGFSRRSVAIGGGIAATLGLAALGVTAPRLFGHRYRRSAYDDLFARLTDRDAATKVGVAILTRPQDGKRIRLDGGFVARVVKQLRNRLERRSLADVTRSDLLQGKLLEAKGWVLPENLALLCVLSAEEA